MRWADLSKTLFLAVLCLWAGAAQAQGGRSLVQVGTRDAGANAINVLLDFDQASPEARIGGNDTNRITVTLLATGRGPNATYQAQASGLLTDIRFNQAAGALQLVFVTNGRAHLDMTTEGQTRFVVKLTALDPAMTGPARPDMPLAAAGGALPQVVDPPPGQDGFELIPLKYADVSEVVGLLSDGTTVRSNDAFIPHEPGFGSPGSNSNTVSTPQTQNLPDDKPLGQPVDSSIAVDRRLNAIWVRGSPEHIARVKAEIARIDLPLASVLLETEFVELTESGAKSLGFDFANAGGQTASASVQAGQYIPPYYATGDTSHLNSLSLQAALYAEIQKGEGRIVSKPKIAAQSGATASIITGDALPILTAITLSGVNGVSQQVQYVNVGVTLQIAPRVTGDGFVTSHVFAVVSSVTGYSQGYPTISQRQAETSAAVKDGQSFVIGGLVQENELKSTIKVPVLGDIPVLGRAFTEIRNTNAKTELFIVITPHIVRSAANG
jgi:general secretion pathway protein D